MLALPRFVLRVLLQRRPVGPNEGSP